MSIPRRIGWPLGLLMLVVIGIGSALYGGSAVSARTAQNEPRPAPAAAAPKPPQKTLPALVTFHFEGGDIPNNAGSVLKKLYEMGLVSANYAPPDKKKGVCGVFTSKTDFPGGCTDELQKLAITMNPRRKGVEQEKLIAYPNAEFDEYSYIVDYNRRSAADMKALEDARTHWKKYIKNEDSDKQHVTLTLTGYQLRLPIDPAANVDADALLKLRSKNVFVDVDTGAKPKAAQFSTPSEDRKNFRDFCTSTAAVDGCYCSLIGEPAIGAPKCDPASTACPDFVVVDSLVFRHPAIAPAMIGGGAPQQAAPDGPLPRCLSREEAEQKRTLYHGTELAGIVASQGNGSSFVGVHPGARMVSVDGPTLTAGNGFLMADAMVSRRMDRGRIPQIYMYASSWRFGANDAEGMRLTKDEYRWTRNLAAARIKQMHQTLWVVAAGQQDLTVDPPLHQYNITTDLALGPMNLGDEENVVVVTACEDCFGEGGGPRLMPNVNYSKAGLVHVAAPGEAIPSTASQFQFGETSGTSVATAFVAGLASAMMTKYSYLDPAAVKARLQYAAIPWITDGDQVVSSGIVDAKVAMWDPHQDYLNGAPVEIEAWCAPSAEHSGLTVVDANNRALENGHVPTHLIYRVLEVPQAADGRRQWVVYQAREKNDEYPGDVVRVGPGWIIPPSSTGPAEHRPFLKLKGQTKAIQLDNVRDLLVRQGRIRVDRCGA